MVDIEALYFAGQVWPWQMVIIGLATYVTFTIPALIAYYIVNDATNELILTLMALLMACMSNAAMVGILFEFYHRGLEYSKQQ